MDRLLLADRTVDLETGEVSTGEGLRPMELRVLRYLSGRSGATVSLDELLQRVWRYAPGVRTRTVHSTLYRLRRGIEADPGSPVHLVTVQGVGVRLVSAVRSTPTPNNLPPGRDSFVGREAELAWLSGSTSRLISVVGPSGVGKTRLVTEWARSELARFPGGAWLVDAADTPSSEVLTERIASVLRCAPEELAARVQPHAGELLLVLDDVGADRADLGEAIRPLVDGCRVVVTSHAPLDFAGEQRIRLGPLVPGSDDPAVDLLVARIQEDDPGFVAAPHSEALTELARELEGFPLALELAASYAALLGPGPALAALRSAGRLANRRQDRPPHHRSTEAMVEHTWSLLQEWARRALLQLSLIDRTFSLDLATRLLAREPGAPDGAEAIRTLVARGLVTSTAEGRYRLYELVRHFVRSRPVDPVFVDRWIACHAELAEGVLVDGLVVDIPALPPDELDAWESVTMRVLGAGRSSLPPPEASIVVYTYVAAHRSLRHTLGDALGARLADVTLPPVCRARFLAGVARVGFRRHLPAAFRISEEVADDAAALGLVQVEINVRLGLARNLALAGRLPEAVASQERALAVRASLPADPSRGLGLERAIAAVESMIHWGSPAAVAAEERCLSLFDQLGNADTRWASGLNLAEALLEAGCPDRATEVVVPLLGERLGDIRRARGLSTWSALLALRGRGREASALGDEAMVLVRDQVEVSLMEWVCVRRVGVRLEVGDDAGAEQDFAYLRSRCGSSPRPRMALHVDFVRASIDAVRGDARAIEELTDVVARTLAMGLSWWLPLEFLAETHGARGDWTAALRTLDGLPTSVSPRGSGVRIRVESLRALGRHAEAARLLSTLSPDRDGFGWTRQALAAARAQAGESWLDPGPPDDDEPWSRIWLARIARARGEPGEVARWLDGATHTTRPRLLCRAIDELRSRGA